MTSTFSLKRMGMILRWNLSNIMHKSLHIMFILAIIFALAYNQITINIPTDIEADGTEYMHLLSFRVIFVIIPIVFFGGATCFCNDIRTKAQRCAHLMLPGTSAEKFAARMLLITVGIIPLIVGALGIADVIQYMLSYIFHSDYHESLLWQTMRLYILPGSPAHLSDLLTVHPDTQYNLAIYSIILWTHSFCLLCGNLFRKQSSVLAILLIIFLMDFTVQSNIDYSKHRAEMMIAVYTSLSVVNYVLSYIIFRRIQIASHKYLNINISFSRL